MTTKTGREGVRDERDPKFAMPRLPNLILMAGN